MKNLKILSAVFFLFFVAFAAQAQIPKIPGAGTSALSSQVLGILDNTSGLNLSGDQSSKLKANNKSFVDQLMKITGGSESDDAKKSSILNLKNGRMKFLNDLLGNELTQKYMGNVLKAINPLKSKLGLAALAF
ncbi:hypothetical protein J0A67_07210 [Algoriphagus aestuariicola]|jgi:hypothetical protein|uniref:DUF3347 domain-containing protein n=1 Tax=Algoriphagus aestuariicola TaxID=1852016 RepID=A0ABS3BMZ1_9BACT|nr:hypothetical protein [Algoriphagus aestuariicola]MBN7800642.1 hypothetical protein [Algoriphagus aestuariicola]